MYNTYDAKSYQAVLTVTFQHRKALRGPQATLEKTGFIQFLLSDSITLSIIFLLLAPLMI